MKQLIQVNKKYLVRLRNPFTSVKAELTVTCQWYFLMDRKYRLELEDGRTGIYLDSEIEVIREVTPLSENQKVHREKEEIRGSDYH